MAFDGLPEAGVSPREDGSSRSSRASYELRGDVVGIAGVAARGRAWVDGLRDTQLATLIGAVLALVGGWPLLFLRLAPYQDRCPITSPPPACS